MYLIEHKRWFTPWSRPSGQVISSSATAIDHSGTKVPAVFRKMEIKQGSLNADIGGGPGNHVAYEELFRPKGAVNIIWDPFHHWRTWSSAVLRDGQADTATLSNVLNVIAEPAERLRAIVTSWDALKDGGVLYVTVYHDKSRPPYIRTQRGWQENRPLRTYVPEIESVGFIVTDQRNNVLIARKEINHG